MLFSFFAQCLQPFEIQTHKNLSAKKMKKTYKIICIYQKSGISLPSNSGRKPERLILFIHLLNFFIMKQTINRKDFYNYTCTISTPCRSQWQKGIEFYAHFLAEKFNDNYLPENIEVEDIFKILLNSAENWHQFAWGGCGQVYNEDIANTLLTPSQRKRITRADTFNGYHLLDLEADALKYASARIYKWARRFANKK